jgi:HEAT repeat protein
MTNESFLAVTGTSNLNEQLRADSELLQRGDAAISEAIALLADDAGDLERRWRTAICLGKIGDQRATEALLGQVQHAAWEMRHSAFWSLCQLADDRSMEAIRAKCTSSALDEQINYVSAIGLGRAFGPAGEQALRNNLNHPDAKVRAWARAALANLDYP